MAQENEEAEGGRLAVLSLTALGVVYGDIGTSPLYAIRECFSGEYAIGLRTRANVLGVLSLVVWSLILVVVVKYLTFILRADNRGEGGVLALMALASPSSRPRPDPEPGRCHPRPVRRRPALRRRHDHPGDLRPERGRGRQGGRHAGFQPRGPPDHRPASSSACSRFQRHGTARIGAVFGPVMLAWFVPIAILGLAAVTTAPVVLRP